MTHTHAGQGVGDANMAVCGAASPFLATLLTTAPNEAGLHVCRRGGHGIFGQGCTATPLTGVSGEASPGQTSVQPEQGH